MLIRLLVVFVLGTGALSAQEPDPLGRADSLLAAGELSEAERLYTAELGTTPSSVRALVGRGTARSWDGRQDQALEDFNAALELDPDAASALTGAAYAHLWSGRFDEGAQLLERLLASGGDDLEARKGLAFAALWSGAPEQAIQRFESLLASYPEEGDAAAGLASAYLAARRPQRSVEAAERAERVAPGRSDVASVRHAAVRLPAPIELSVNAGHTRFDGGQSPAGVSLRSVDLAVRPTADLTLLGQYDDGISVDTRALALGGADAPTYRGAAVVAWGGRMLTRAGYGRRSLPDATHQRLIELDQTVVLGRWAVSAGLSDVDHEGPAGEQAVRTGLLFAPTQQWELGVTGHLRSVEVGPRGTTMVATVTHKLNAPVDVLTGLVVGRDPGPSREPQRELFFHVSARPWGGNGFSLTLRRQFGPRPDRLTVLAAGITVGLGRG